jgi:ubiquinone biosynthesis protein
MTPDTVTTRSQLAREAPGIAPPPRAMPMEEERAKGALGRAVHIFFAVLTYGLWRVFYRLGLTRRSTPARRFAQLLEHLGTTFVKLGQHLSLRSDLFPPDYLAALQTLQDNVKPFPAEQATAAIVKAFGRQPSELFASYDPEPFAAASVAQVHAATLFDGRAVAVKILRPGVAAQVDLDMRLLLGFVRFVSYFSPVLTRYHAEAVIRQVWSSLAKELDLTEEARNCRRFAVAFNDSPTIAIPDIVEPLCSRRVLVQERAFGRKVDEVPDAAARHQLAQNFLDAFVYQFFMLGFFHADPHPGNLLVRPDGKISLHDFGMVGSLDRHTRHALAAFMLGFAEQDPEWVLDSWLELGMLSTGNDRKPLQPVVAEIMAEYARRPLRDWSVGAAFGELISAARDRQLAVPMHLLVLGRAILLIEGTVRILDPEFNMLESMRERSKDVIEVALKADPAGSLRLQYEAAIAGTEWQRLVAGAVRKLREDGIRVAVEHEGLPELAEQIVKAGSRVTLGLVTLGLYLAASLLMQQSFGPRILDIPALSFVFYLTAAWFTFRLTRTIGRRL